MRPQLVSANSLFIEDDHIPTATAAGSVEPMRRADHKAKKHGRPAPVRYVRPVSVKRECGE